MARASKNGSTIMDIARELGISAMTVSRALTGNTEVSEATRRKVERCAKALNYQPNRWARSLVTRRSSIVGVVIPNISHAFFAEITFGVEEALEPAGYDILLCHSRGDPARERAEVRMLVGSKVDGLIVASEQPEGQPELFEELNQTRIPFVLVDRFFPRHVFRSVRADDREAGRLATDYLLELGHRRTAHIRGPELSSASLRYRGYVEALNARGVPARRDYVEAGNFDIQGGREAMHRLLARKHRPTAVFAANDPMAIGAIYACRDGGLRVPEDVSIVGAGNIEGVHHPNPFVTTIDWPRAAMGRTAAEILLAAIDGRENPARGTTVFPPRLLVRQSTACAKA
jgi:LacI family transcriptional regulator